MKIAWSDGLLQEHDEHDKNIAAFFAMPETQQNTAAKELNTTK